MKKIVFILYLLMIMVANLFSQQHDYPKLKGPYLGQSPPGDSIELFAPGILPMGTFHTTPVFTPDGKEVYWKMLGSETISMMKLESDGWTKPEEITLSSKLNDFRDPCITPDGKKMFFLSKGKLPYQAKEKENIWYVEKQDDGWSEPQPLNEEINSHALHWQVSAALNGNLYFTSRDSRGFEDIYYSKFRENKYGTPEKLSNAINTSELCETTPFISPDEKYLIFSRWKLRDKEGLMKLYISFRDKEGNWKKARKIEKIDYGLCPQVSLDQKYFFFMGMVDGKIKVMWVNAKILEEFRPEQ